MKRNEIIPGMPITIEVVAADGSVAKIVGQLDSILATAGTMVTELRVMATAMTFDRVATVTELRP